MKNSRASIWLAGAVILLLTAVIAGLSVKNASKNRYAFTGVSFGGQAQLRNTIEIPLSEIDSLNVEYGSKNLRIFTGGDDKIVIKEYLVDEDKAALAENKIIDRKAEVRGGRSSSFIFFGFNMEERIEIYLPEKGLNYLALSTKSGNISVQPGYAGTYEGMELAAGSGNIKWSNAATDGSIATGSGNVKLENMTGSLEVVTGSGNITIDDLTGQGGIQASSGNVKVLVRELTGDISLEAGSGNVKLELPEKTSAHLKLETGSGNIDTDIDDILSFNKDGDYADGDLGTNPVNQVKASTGSGNIRINVN